MTPDNITITWKERIFNNCKAGSGLCSNVKKKCTFYFVGLCLLFVQSSCYNGGKPEYTDTPTNGQIRIAVDESYQLLFDTEIYTFQSFYKYAKINANYVPEAEAIKELLNDSVRFAVMSRGLNENEKKYFDEKKLTPRVTKIAIDAVAFILNKENPDSLFTLEQIHSLFSGEYTLWNQLNHSRKNDPINIVFDNSGSGNARFIRETLLKGLSFKQNCFAVTSNPEVVDYVSSHPNSIGVIGVNWISDTDDKLTVDFLKKIKVASIFNDQSKEFYKPFQAYIQMNSYPFCRDVYIISREARAGLGTGFSAFVAGEKGQRIILKSGLVPAIAPVRVVVVK